MPETPESFAGATVAVVRRSLQSRLAQAAVDDAAREARLLLEHATALTPEQLLCDSGRTLSLTEAQTLSAALARRLANEPLSRIRGNREFYGRSFKVTPAVLDPRPDTETLIEVVLHWVDESGGRQRPLTILDVGTGSGCILATLLSELPLATGLGTDVSAEALDVARTNADRNEIAGRARFEIARSLNGIDGPFDILVSNPPYIPTADIAGLDVSVRDFDPKAALDGGPDGLAIYREIAAGAGRVVPCGLIALEVGAGQAAEVARILAKTVENRTGSPWTRADLGGHERTVALLTQS